jgi:hypothetical protein
MYFTDEIEIQADYDRIRGNRHFRSDLIENRSICFASSLATGLTPATLYWKSWKRWLLLVDP